MIPFEQFTISMPSPEMKLKSSRRSMMTTFYFESPTMPRKGQTSSAAPGISKESRFLETTGCPRKIVKDTR